MVGGGALVTGGVAGVVVLAASVGTRGGGRAGPTLAGLRLFDLRRHRRLTPLVLQVRLLRLDLGDVDFVGLGTERTGTGNAVVLG